VSMGFRISVSLYPAILTTWLLTFAMAGLSPAEYTSLRWTHNRTFGFPEHLPKTNAKPQSLDISKRIFKFNYEFFSFFMHLILFA